MVKKQTSKREKAAENKQLSRTEQKKRDRINNIQTKDPVKMKQIDGKVYSKYGHKSLDEILGINVSKYKTHDVKEYEGMLNSMNTSDLQSHAASVQVMPKEDRRLLIQLLIKQFKINNSLILNPAKEVNVAGKIMTQAALDVLSEGR